MAPFKNSTTIAKDILAIMEDRAEMDCDTILSEMKKRFGIEVVRSTVFYYLGALVASKKAKKTTRKERPGLGRPKTYYQMVA